MAAIVTVEVALQTLFTLARVRSHMFLERRKRAVVTRTPEAERRVPCVTGVALTQLMCYFLAARVVSLAVDHLVRTHLCGRCSINRASSTQTSQPRARMLWEARQLVVLV